MLQHAWNLILPPSCATCKHYRPPAANAQKSKCARYATVTISGKTELLEAEVARAIVCYDAKDFEPKAESPHFR